MSQNKTKTRQFLRGMSEKSVSSVAPIGLFLLYNELIVFEINYYR